MSEEKKEPVQQKVRVRLIKSAAGEPIEKADGSLQVEDEEYHSGEWITPMFNLERLSNMVDESTILPQCITAYAQNIAGFGIGIRYKDEFSDLDEDTNPEMKAEWDRLSEILDLLTVEYQSNELFENIIRSEETYGCAYLEVIRNNLGEVVELAFIRDPPTIRKSKRSPNLVDYVYYYNGKAVTRKKRFARYKQTVGPATTYYKEFGDPRMMDSQTGEYSDSVSMNRRANEILEFTLGTSTYGKVRWIGQVLTVDGARKAEALNNNYFRNGRHTPLLITVEGGTLSDESFAKLKEYMEEIKGEAGQHAFMVLETETTDNRTGFTDTEKPKIDVKNIASILQKDELFQEYLANGRRKVQSSFMLPDLYVGYTTDFNRATSQTAMEVTEKQVFQPARERLAWIINNKLLNGYQFKYVEVFFNAPDITNPDDIAKIINALRPAGAVTPNFAKEYLYKMLGKTAEQYDGDWADVPVDVWKMMQQSNTPQQAAEEQLEQQIMKAQFRNETELVAVMKEVLRMMRNDDAEDGG